MAFFGSRLRGAAPKEPVAPIEDVDDDYEVIGTTLTHTHTHTHTHTNPALAHTETGIPGLVPVAPAALSAPATWLAERECLLAQIAELKAQLAHTHIHTHTRVAPHTRARKHSLSVAPCVAHIDWSDTDGASAPNAARCSCRHEPHASASPMTAVAGASPMTHVSGTTAAASPGGMWVHPSSGVLRAGERERSMSPLSLCGRAHTHTRDDTDEHATDRVHVVTPTRVCEITRATASATARGCNLANAVENACVERPRGSHTHTHAHGEARENRGNVRFLDGGASASAGSPERVLTSPGSPALSHGAPEQRHLSAAPLLRKLLGAHGVPMLGAAAHAHEQSDIHSRLWRISHTASRPTRGGANASGLRKPRGAAHEGSTPAAPGPLGAHPDADDDANSSSGYDSDNEEAPGELPAPLPTQRISRGVSDAVKGAPHTAPATSDAPAHAGAPEHSKASQASVTPCSPATLDDIPRLCTCTCACVCDGAGMLSAALAARDTLIDDEPLTTSGAAARALPPSPPAPRPDASVCVSAREWARTSWHARLLSDAHVAGTQSVSASTQAPAPLKLAPSSGSRVVPTHTHTRTHAHTQAGSVTSTPNASITPSSRSRSGSSMLLASMLDFSPIPLPV